MGGLRPRDIAVLGPLLAAVVAGSLMAIGARGADTAFLRGETQSSRLPAAEVERALRTAPEPGSGEGRGTSASCRPGGRRGLRNPWSCTVTYPAGRRARFAVTIREDGSFVARHAGGGGVRGCCVSVPAGVRRGG